MTICTLDDVRADNPKLKLGPSTVPSETDVTNMITNIESEVQARVESCNAPMPAPNTAAAAYFKRTILEGVRWMYLRAMYTFSSQGSQSPDIDRAYRAYMDRLGQICDIARSAQNVMDTQSGQPAFRRSPQVAVDVSALSPNLSSSFAEHTQAVDIVDWMRTGQRYTGNRPWPLR